MIAIGYRKKIVGPADANGGKDNGISGLAIRPNELSCWGRCRHDGVRANERTISPPSPGRGTNFVRLLEAREMIRPCSPGLTWSGQQFDPISLASERAIRLVR